VTGVPDGYNIFFPSLLDLASAVDVLIIAAAGGSGTRHLINRIVLEALGPRGYLINIARGSVVDQEALVQLLVAGAIGGAGLDVFADEPQVPAALLTMDNVVLTPHLASGTVETRAAMSNLVLENVRSYLSKGDLVTPVPEMWGSPGKVNSHSEGNERND